ncbi:MAG TPA: MAPEG family protein [Burkholderiaceae bacterium]|jgi:hypothetical protein
MPVPITAMYAAILAIILTALAINVTVHRAKLDVPIGQSDNPLMLRMIRIHGNAAEYIPITLLLMLVYEINGGNHIALHGLGLALVAARLLHVWGMWHSTKPTFGRIVGPTVTWLVILALAILNVLRVV